MVLTFQTAFGSTPFTFNGNWRTENSKNDGYRESLQQNYSLNLEQDISEAMELQESFRYTRNWEGDGGTIETYNPALDFLVQNDLFIFDLKGQSLINRNSEGANTTLHSWEVNWNSTWRKKLWPRLRFDFGQDFNTNDENPRTLDTRNDEWGAGVDWGYGPARLQYFYDSDKYTNEFADSENSSNEHFVRIDVGQTFWEDRLVLNLSQQLTHQSNDFFIQGAPGDTVLLPVSLGQVTADIDDTPLDGFLTPQPGLNDRNIDVSGLSSDPLDLNIGLKTDLQSTDLIYVYTVEDLETILGPIVFSGFRWDLYSSTDAENWQLEETDLTYTYNSAQKFFEIDITEIQRVYLKVVAVNPTPTGTVVDFSEVEAYDTIVLVSDSFSSSRDIEDYLTNASIGFRFNEKMNMLYSMSYNQRNLSDTGDQTSLIQTGTLNWQYSPTLLTVFSINDSRNEVSGNPEVVFRDYRLNFLPQIIPTLDINFGLTRNETYSGSAKTSTQHSFNIYAEAQVFPAMDLSLDTEYSINDNEELGQETKNFYANLDTTARITPKMTVNFRNQYDNTRSDAGSRNQLDSNLSMSWRLTDILLIQFFGNSTLDSENDNSLGLGLNMTSALTDNTQLNFLYDMQDSSDEITQRALLGINWTIGKFFIFRSNVQYMDNADEDDLSVSTDLIMRFSGF